MTLSWTLCPQRIIIIVRATSSGQQHRHTRKEKARREREGERGLKAELRVWKWRIDKRTEQMNGVGDGGMESATECRKEMMSDSWRRN